MVRFSELPTPVLQTPYLRKSQTSRLHTADYWKSQQYCNTFPGKQEPNPFAIRKEPAV